MRVALIVSSFFAICLAAPAAVSPVKPVGLIPGDCFCSYPICPMELIAECKCKNAHAEACYQASVAKGFPCEKPVPEVCGAVAYAIS
ncbi:hypothetical protein IQ07DRAFT_587068 [Pyrenochaeta sp. DS3sAY3a]|nr:hypothetical protein IQ07DRAFT_587068 [Pyrenochaeta sp. DS3sAY3a]